MSPFPTDGLPRFKATDRSVLDRANCHRIVKTWERLGSGHDGQGVHVHPQAKALAAAEAALLNALDAAGATVIQPAPGRQRATHCPHGHEYTPENTYEHASGRQCRVCRRAANQRDKQKRRQAA